MKLNKRCFNYQDFHEIHCDKRVFIVKKGGKHENFISTEIEWIPNNKVVESKDNLELANILEDLDNNDDVQNILNLNLITDNVDNKNC